MLSSCLRVLPGRKDRRSASKAVVLRAAGMQTSPGLGPAAPARAAHVHDRAQSCRACASALIGRTGRGRLGASADGAAVGGLARRARPALHAVPRPALVAAEAEAAAARGAVHGCPAAAAAPVAGMLRGARRRCAAGARAGALRLGHTRRAVAGAAGPRRARRRRCARRRRGGRAAGVLRERGRRADTRAGGCRLRMQLLRRRHVRARRLLRSARAGRQRRDGRSRLGPARQPGLRAQPR